MHAPQINPILLADVLTDPNDESIEPLLRAIEQDPTSNVTIQRFQERVVLVVEDELYLEAAADE